MVRQMIGAKGGGGGSSFITKPDSLRSNDSFEILLGLGSGRWKGLVDGLQSFKINNVPLENEDGTSNFENVFLIFADGNPLEDQIVNFTLGGGGNSQTVNTQLANANPSGPGGWVSGAVLTPGANFIDLRFIAQQLFYQDKKSIRENTATIEIEMRPSGSSTWINIFAAPTSNNTVYNPGGYDYIEDYGGYTGRIYLSQNMFNPGGVGFRAGNGLGMPITGKTSSAFVKEIRVSVPNTGDYASKTWEVRARLVEKDTVDNGDIQERRNILFETITAIINEPLGDDPEWDGLVWAKIHGKASDQFNGFPEMTGIFDTKICKVPPGTVFNPETRAYTVTTWDGSYVEAFTRDPAWQIKEFVEDPVHGLAGLNPGSTLDKWDALEASKYFSELVPDGDGGEHPRFSMNYTINEAKEVDEQMQFLAGAVNSYTEDIGGGVWRFKVDKPETPIMLFTEDNIFGEFSYAHSPIDTRFNDWRGTFLDETLDYETNTVRVFDQADIDANGTKFTEIALIGCTHPQEALRRLMFRLRVSLNEYKMVSFTTNRVGRLISPLSTILVADGALNPSHLIKSTSRLHSYAGSNVILKRAVRLQSGVTYKMKFTTTDMEVVERTVTNSSGLPGDIIAITLNSALPGNIMPDSAVALEAVGLAALPVAYRVVGVERSEDNEDEYMVSAVMIDVGKWDAMDNVDADALAAQEASISIGSPTVPDDGMFLVVDYTTEFQVKKVLQVNWNRPSSMFLDGFQVEYRLNDGQWRIGAALLKDSIFELQNPEDGTYDFKITALDRRGVKSNPLLGRYEFDGDAQVTPPAHDRGEIGDRPTEGLYNGYRYTATDTDPPVVFVWDATLKIWVPEVNLVTEGSQIGVENGATVGMTPAQAALFAAAQAAIDDLFATYGDTASASAAAAAAEVAKNDAIDAATAANGYATIASTKRDEAQGYMETAQASAVTAGDAASVSTAQAAAASASESSAATSSALSASYSAGANLAALATLPSTFEQDGSFFCEGNGGGWTGAPASLSSIPGNVVYGFSTLSAVGRVAYTISAAASTDIAQKGVVAIRAGRKYRVSATHSMASGTRGVSVYALHLDSSYTYLSSDAVSVTSNTSWQTASTGILDGTALVASGVSYLRAMARYDAGGSVGRFSMLKIEDVTESQTAATQAGIATTQAAAATASAAAASSSETLSASSELAASTSASIATAQAAIATSNAAAAQASMVLAASLSRGYLNNNANFMDWGGGGNAPDSAWLVWNPLGANTSIRSPVSGIPQSGQPEGSPWSQGSAITSASQYTGLVSDPVYITPGRYAVEATAFKDSGSWLGSGIYIAYYSASANLGVDYLAFGLDADIAGVTSTSQAGLRKWSRNCVFPAGTVYVVLYTLANYSSGFGTASTKTMYFLKCGIKAGDATDAMVSTHSSVLATHESKLASWVQSTSAGAGYAEISMKAVDVNGNAASVIGVRADQILLGDMTGTVLEISGGEALFTGNIRAGGGIFVGDSAIPVALQSFNIEVYDGMTVSYGADLGFNPLLSPDFSTFPTLLTSNFYVFRAESQTPTGFVARVKKSTTATYSTVTTAAGTAPGSGPTYQVNKTNSADAYNGNYTFAVSGTIYREVEQISSDPVINKYRGYIDFQTYFRPAGDTLWTTGPVVRMNAGSGTTGSVSYSRTITANFGTAIGLSATNTEFGITKIGDYGVGTNTLTGVGSVSYQKTSGGTETTATPSNVPLLTVRVIPQNA